MEFLDHLLRLNAETHGETLLLMKDEKKHAKNLSKSYITDEEFVHGLLRM